jgi:hypothetical protein
MRPDFSVKSDPKNPTYFDFWELDTKSSIPSNPKSKKIFLALLKLLATLVLSLAKHKKNFLYLIVFSLFFVVFLLGLAR